MVHSGFKSCTVSQSITRRKFYAKVCVDFAAWQYVRENPVRAGLAERVEDLAAFRSGPRPPGFFAQVLPTGALDDEQPDEQRLMEATGNEGASFERAYHRAALVIWPLERLAGVLLQAGVGAALPHLAERVAACRGVNGTAAQCEPVLSIAEQIIESWENAPEYRSWRSLAKEPSRGEMLKLLSELGAAHLLERFISGVVAHEYDGSENEPLAATVALLGPKTTGRLFSILAHENARLFHCACVDLLHRVIRELGEKLTADWKKKLRGFAAEIVGMLPNLKPQADPCGNSNWQRVQSATPGNAAMVVDLLEALRALDAVSLRAEAVRAIAANASVFDPVTVVVPALKTLWTRERKGFASDSNAALLWTRAAEYLLARSEVPPAAPTDWRQGMTISCDCADCREFQKFARDPVAQAARFKMAEHRRAHLEGKIRHHGLDMNCVTERKGSPRTLVCTKTRRTYERECEQHRADCAAMSALLDVRREAAKHDTGLFARLAAAKELKPQT